MKYFKKKKNESKLYDFYYSRNAEKYSGSNFINGKPFTEAIIHKERPVSEWKDLILVCTDKWENIEYGEGVK